jgi:hypothetical protein
MINLFHVIGFRECEKGLEISFFYPHHVEECLKVIADVQEEFVDLNIEASEVTDELIFKGLDEKVREYLSLKG